MDHWLYLENTDETLSSPYIVDSTPTKAPNSHHNPELLVTSNEYYYTHQCARNMKHVKSEAQNPPNKKHNKNKNNQVRLKSWVDKNISRKTSHELKHKKYARRTHSLWYNLCLSFWISRFCNTSSFFRSNISGDEMSDSRNN